MRAKLAITFRCACLLLAVAAAGLWVRSHYVSDSFRWNVSPPPPAVSTTAPATNGRADALFLLLKSQDFAKSYRSVETIPGRLVVERQTTYEVFVWPSGKNAGWSSRKGLLTSFADAYLPSLGFAYTRTGQNWHLAIPFWAILATFGSPFALWCFGRGSRLRRNRLAQGLCADCGYDLRATPGRCPECGAGRIPSLAVPA